VPCYGCSVDEYDDDIWIPTYVCTQHAQDARK
jgi:hypothetical protein